MTGLRNIFVKWLKIFSGWFNRTFAWFFTNGMKQIEDYSEEKRWRIVIPPQESSEV